MRGVEYELWGEFLRIHYNCFDCGSDSFEIEFEKGAGVKIEEKAQNGFGVQRIYLRPEQIIVICKQCHSVVSDGFRFFQES